MDIGIHIPLLLSVHNPPHTSLFITIYRVHTWQQRCIRELPNELLPLLLALSLRIDILQPILLHVIHRCQDPVALKLSARRAIAQRGRSVRSVSEEHVWEVGYR
jgi:hypothetical protein